MRPIWRNDSFYVWLNNYHWVPTIALAALLAAIGGLPLVLWGLCFRVVFGLHATWLVNSATHMWGSRRFETHDDSRNNWWVALITFGEGWHNNHHAYPTSARHGLAWYEFDPSWIEISFLRLAGHRNFGPHRGTQRETCTAGSRIVVDLRSWWFPAGRSRSLRSWHWAPG